MQTTQKLHEAYISLSETVSAAAHPTTTFAYRKS